MVVCFNTTRLSVGPGFMSTNKTFDAYKMSVKQEYKIFKTCANPMKLINYRSLHFVGILEKLEKTEMRLMLK